jgi:hypothetical protein
LQRQQGVLHHYSRVIVAPVVRFRRMVLGMVTLLVLLR